jgi:hypothetical protein
MFKTMKKGFLASLMMGAALAIVPVASLVAPTQAVANDYEDYRYMSCYDLWYARNAIFANKGYCFRTRRGINTFGRRCYPPYGRLNRWEKDQVNEIRYWERRKGCR